MSPCCTDPVAQPLVFQHGAPETVFYVAIGGWVAFEGVMELRQRRRLGARPGRDPSRFVLAAMLGLAIFGAIRIGQAHPVPWPGGRVWPFVVGIALIATGVGLRAWSIATLGRFFQYRITVQAEHRVVAEGPYRYVRHPSYSGLALVLLGIAVAAGDVLSIVPAAVLGGIGLAIRIRAEERQLIDALGPEYEQFAARRKRLVPGIW